MTIKRNCFKWLVASFLLPMVVALSACASGPRLVDHAFSFDVLADSPDVTLLDYRYGTSKHPGARPPDWALRNGLIEQHSSVNGGMILGDTLYVKWRVKATNEVIEDTVDLKSRLPRDITDHRVYFVIKDKQLWVYLISPEKRPPTWPKYEPPGWTHRKVYVIYPISTLNQ